MANASKKKARKKSVLVGLGLDSDGHKRLTSGPNFLLVGGSEETHEVMTEKAIKINESSPKRGNNSTTCRPRSLTTSLILSVSNAPNQIPATNLVPWGLCRIRRNTALIFSWR